MHNVPETLNPCGSQGVSAEDSRLAADVAYEAAMERRRQEVEAERRAAESAQVGAPLLCEMIGEPIKRLA